jgi:hypothetical protein
LESPPVEVERSSCLPIYTIRKIPSREISDKGKFIFQGDMITEQQQIGTNGVDNENDNHYHQ